MADSEDSRTLLKKGYGNLLSDTAHLLSELATQSGEASVDGTTEALAKWAAWSLAYADHSRLFTVRQRLESKLFKTAAAQRNQLIAAAASLNRPEPSECDAQRDVPSSIEPDIALCGRQREATEEAASHRRARADEDAASAREQLLAEALWSVSGKSAVSAMAKLHCILEQGEPVPDSGEFPWLQIRSALADLLIASASDTATLPDFRERRSYAVLS